MDRSGAGRWVDGWMGGMGGWMNTNPFDHHTELNLCPFCLFLLWTGPLTWLILSLLCCQPSWCSCVPTEMYVTGDQNCISFPALLHKVLYTAAADSDCHTYILSSMGGIPVELSGSWPLFLDLALVPQAMGSGVVVLPAFICHRGSFQGRIVWSLFARQAERC